MKRILIIPFVFITLSLFAAPIGEKQAREIALQFFASQGTRSASPRLEIEWAGSDIASERTINATRSSATNNENLDEALVYIYNRTDTNGFVVVAGDDNVNKPILAFSRTNTFTMEDMPDGAKAILQGWCEQIANARSGNNLSATTRATTYTTGEVVCEYETALWGQSEPFNNESPILHGVKVPCGCVATAAGIICYYHKWPEKGVGTTPEYTYTEEGEVDEVTIPENKLGRAYDYSLMKSDYSRYSYKEGAMVAALLYDLGTAFQMSFNVDGSGANTKEATHAMMTYFGYSKGALFLSHSGRSEAEWTAILQENLKDYGPVFFKGRTKSSGHAFVLDGYTSGGYFRINYGWNGKSNGYYLLPNISYYKDQGAAFYMVPDRDGSSTYRDYLALSKSSSYKGLHTKATEYKVGEKFSVRVRITNKGMGPFSGKYCVAHCDKEDNIKEILFENDCGSENLPPSYSHGKASYVTISESIAVGDRLRVFYKSQNSDNWELVLRNNDDVSDKVLLKATAEDVAESLNLTYNKGDKSLVFTSEHAIQYSMTDASGVEVSTGNVPSFTSTTIDLSSLEPGTYTCLFASGGKPYILTLKL